MGKVAILGIGEGELLAVSVLCALAVLIHPQGLRIFAGEPGGRSGGWGAQDNHDVVSGCLFDGVVEPGEVVFALFGFHGAPGEFAHPHQVNVAGFHSLQIRVPLGLRPLLRIPGCAQKYGRRSGELRSLCRGLRMGGQQRQHDESGAVKAIKQKRPGGNLDGHHEDIGTRQRL